MKTVKTLLHEIVKLSGADGVKYLNLVPSSPVQDASSERMKQPVIFTYVQLMMKALGIRKLPDQATPITSFTSAAGSPETTVQMQANQENLGLIISFHIPPLVLCTFQPPPTKKNKKHPLALSLSACPVMVTSLSTEHAHAPPLQSTYTT